MSWIKLKAIEDIDTVAVEPAPWRGWAVYDWRVVGLPPFGHRPDDCTVYKLKRTVAEVKLISEGPRIRVTANVRFWIDDIRPDTNVIGLNVPCSGIELIAADFFSPVRKAKRYYDDFLLICWAGLSTI